MALLTTELLENPEFHNQVKSIIKNGDISLLTATQIRSELESHFDLEKDVLKQKPYKKTVNAMIDKIYAELQQTEEKETQEKTPQTTDSSREASPVKLSPKKRKAASPEKLDKKRTKVEFDNGEEQEEEEEEVVKPKKTFKKKRHSKKVISESENEGDEDEKEVEYPLEADKKTEDEEMKDISDEEDKADEEEEEEEEIEEEENDYSTPPPSKKKTTKKPIKTNAAPTKDDESVKRLKQFINKCGVRKLWAKELADCKNAAAEVRKLKSMLEELGVQGRPTLEKCEAVKKERELKAELDSLDTSLIMNDTGRRTRTRNNAQSKPSYAVDESSSGEEEEEEEGEDGSANENKDGNEEESGNESETKTDNNNSKEESDSEEEESSGDEFKGDDSDSDA